MSDSGDWCLIESDPGVFTELIEGFGVKGLECDEIYDVSSTSNISDAYGLIFLFKWERQIDNPGKAVEGEKLRSIFFAEQVIQNACATQAIVNVLLNLPSEKVDLGDILLNFKSFVSDFDSKMKGSALTNCDKMRKVHNSFSPPTLYELDDKKYSKTEDAYHFVGYVPIDGVVYELDGLRPTPLEHGAIPDGASWIDVIWPVLTARLSAAADGKFNLMAIVPNRKEILQKRLLELHKRLDVSSQEITDLQNDISRENLKAARNRTENLRRRHNYLPFIIEVLKVLAEQGRLVDVVKKSKQIAKHRQGRTITNA